MKRCPAPSNRRYAFMAGLLALAAGSLAAPGEARAEVPVKRTRFQLPSSNGHSAILLDLEQRRVTHFREHLFATEEPKLDAAGNEIWENGQFGVVHSRDLVYDAYFGLRSGGSQRWLTTLPVDLDASGYAPFTAGKVGGTGVITMVQSVDSLQLTQFFFAPQALPHGGFVMAMRVVNKGASAAPGVSAFSIHNFHLGAGRPGVRNDIDANGETISLDTSGGKADFIERAFAGVIAARPLAPIAHHGTTPAASIFDIVDKGSMDLPDQVNPSVADDAVSAYQWDLGDIEPGAEKWVGVAFTHHGNPSADKDVQGWLDAYVGAQDAKALVEAELAGWESYQNDVVKLPAQASGDEEALLRQSAAILRMAQVREESTYLRQWLSADDEPRYTRFGATKEGPPASLPAQVEHRGKGAVIASLPPGEWTIAWIRDGAYAASAMSALGMNAEARAALLYYLEAEGGRFREWEELKPYSMPPYQISLCRYYGFGIEETDFNEAGPNIEFDGFGLFLWALRNYETLSGDKTLVDQTWPTVKATVADAIVALIDPATGLMRPDSSIWETHWIERRRSWSYTNITAARGLCDAAALATRVGDMERATVYRDAGMKLRDAIAKNLTDKSCALVSSKEELDSGQGYFDAAVLDGIAMGLFDPKGAIAASTLKALDENLYVAAGAGWSRNDDWKDHPGTPDLSPWGGTYDSAEWVVTDLRGAVATRLAGDVERSDRLLAWVRTQAEANYLAVAETYDETTGEYKFNAPMVGFGAGAYALAIAARTGTLVDPACGAYYDESSLACSGGGAGGAGGVGGAGGADGAESTSSTGSGAGSGAGTGGAASGGDGGEDGGCGCRAAGAGGQGMLPAALIGLALLLRRRRSPSAGAVFKLRGDRSGGHH